MSVNEKIIKIGHSLFGVCTLFLAFLTLMLGFGLLDDSGFRGFAITMTVIAMMGVVSSAVVTAVKRMS